MRGILECIQEPMNASSDPLIPSTTDIHSTKIPKPKSVDKSSYFSFFKSFISVEHESLLKDRDGVVLVVLDGVQDTEVVELLIDMKKRNDVDSQEVGLLSG